MISMFTFFKFLHVAAVILWIGGVCTLTLLNLRLTSEQDRGVLAALHRQANFYRQARHGPPAADPPAAGARTPPAGGLLRQNRDRGGRRAHLDRGDRHYGERWF